MPAKKSAIKTAELISLHHERGQKPNVFVVRYHPGYKEAYGMITQEDGDSGPITLSTFGDSFNAKRLRAAWKTWGRLGDDSHSFEWTPGNAVGSFVRWLNSGGEGRVARAREARRGR